jgi:hypothetical protein
MNAFSAAMDVNGVNCSSALKVFAAVRLRRAHQKIVKEIGWAEETVIPGEVEVGKPFKRKVQTFAWGTYVSISEWASASPWKGKPVRQSSYA